VSRGGSGDGSPIVSCMALSEFFHSMAIKR